MPAVPSACQDLADRVTSLEAQYTTLAAQAADLVGPPAWAALAQLGTLRLAVSAARVELADCVRTHSAALTGTLVAIDGGGGPPGMQTVTLWDLSTGGPVAREVSQLRAGTFSFQGPLPAGAALSVQTAGGAEITGLDFRSGPLPGPLDATAPRVEIVLGPTIAVPAGMLSQWAGSIPPTSQRLPPFSGLNLGSTPMELAIGGWSVALAAGTISMSASGTLSGGIVPGGLPWTATITLGLMPANAPHVDDVVAVTLAGANPVSVAVAAGPGLGGLVGSLVSVVAPFLGPLIRDALDRWANTALPDAIAAGLALGALPDGTRVSFRSIRVGEEGITFQPALGLIGTGLSTFHPAPLPLPPV